MLNHYTFFNNYMQLKVFTQCRTCNIIIIIIVHHMMIIVWTHKLLSATLKFQQKVNFVSCMQHLIGCLRIMYKFALLIRSSSAPVCHGCPNLANTDGSISEMRVAFFACILSILCLPAVIDCCSCPIGVPTTRSYSLQSGVCR